MEIKDLTLQELLQKFPQTRPHINQYYGNPLSFRFGRPISTLESDQDKKLWEIFDDSYIRTIEYYIINSKKF